MTARPTIAGRAMRLTDEEIERYRSEGLVQPACRIPAAMLSNLRDALETLLAATPHLPPEALVTPHVPGAFGLPREVTDRWLGFCTDEGVIDMVEQVLGPDIVLWGSQVFCKPAGTGMEIPWHQDGAYWPVRPLATCSVWIAIDDVTAENGAMRYIPGSHRECGLLPHLVSERVDRPLSRELDATSFDASRARLDELPAGGMSLHDVFLVHGSAANRSARRRAAFVIRYMPASSHYDRSAAIQDGSALIDVKLRDRPIYLLRGRDHTGKTGLVDLRRRSRLPDVGR